MPYPSCAPCARGLTQNEVMLILEQRESCTGSKLYRLTSTKFGIIAAYEFKAGVQGKPVFVFLILSLVFRQVFLYVPCLSAEA